MLCIIIIIINNLYQHFNDFTTASWVHCTVLMPDRHVYLQITVVPDYRKQKRLNCCDASREMVTVM